MTQRFNPAPGWPAAPEGWLPFEGWTPDPSWPPAPQGWQIIVEDAPPMDPDAVWQAVGRPMTGLAPGKYKLTATMLYVERGLLSTNRQQVPVIDVLDVDVRQSMIQKSRGVGNVLVHVRRASGRETAVIEDVEDFRHAQTIINETAHSARLTAQRLANTHQYVGSQPLGLGNQQPATSPPPESDPVAQLEKLGRLRDTGLLTDEEFVAKKAEILARL